MGAKALSPMAISENPEDWHMHHFRSKSDIFTPTLYNSVSAWASPAREDGKIRSALAIENKREVSDDSLSEPEGDPAPPGDPAQQGEEDSTKTKSLKIDSLVAQLEGVISKMESSEDVSSQRLLAAEEESRELAAKAALLNAALERAQRERARTAEENAKLLEQLAKQEHDTSALLQEKEKLAEHRAAQAERVSVVDYEHAKNQYEALQQEFDSHKTLLQTQVNDFHAQLKSEAERVVIVEQERAELMRTVSALTEQIAAIEVATTSRAAESAKVIEHLERQEQRNQSLVCEKKEAVDRLKAYETKLQESVSLERHQILESQYQRVQQEFETFKATASGNIDSLQETLQEKVSKYQEQLALEVQRLAVAEKDRTDLSNTVSSLNEQIAAMQTANASRVESNSSMMDRLDRQYQDIMRLVQEKQGLLAQLAAQNNVPFDDHEALQKSHQALLHEHEAYKSQVREQLETLQKTVASEREKNIADGQRVETLERERSDLSKSMFALNEQIAVLEATSVSRSVESAKVLELLAKQEKDNEELLKEKHHLLEQLASERTLLSDSISLETHQAVERQYHSTEQEFESYKEHVAQQVSGLENLNEKLRVDNERLVVVQKERDDLLNTVSTLTEKMSTMQILSVSEAAENAKALESLGTRYKDIYELVKEKQKKVAKLAAQDTVPFEFYKNCKKEYQILHKQFESYKVNATEQICSLEASLTAEASKCDAILSIESNRSAALEKERDELSDTIATVKNQMNKMQAANTSQAEESAKALEALAKQYKDIFHIVQDKQHVLANLAADEAQLQHGSASEAPKAALLREKTLVSELSVAQEENRTLQQRLAASKADTTQKLLTMESTLQDQEKRHRERQATLGSEARRLVTLERERDELLKTVASLNDKMASMRSGEEYEALRAHCQGLQIQRQMSPRSRKSDVRKQDSQIGAPPSISANKSAPTPSAQSLTRANQNASRGRAVVPLASLDLTSRQTSVSSSSSRRSPSAPLYRSVSNCSSRSSSISVPRMTPRGARHIPRQGAL